MGSLFRSEQMCLAQLYLQSEAAFACVSKLGELGLVQFTDLNPDVNAFQRKFVNDVRRCDEMERKLRFLERELKKDDVKVFDNGENPPAPVPREMIELEGKFEKLEKDMKEINTNQEALKKNFLELTEMKQILIKAQHFFQEASASYEQESSQVGGGEYSRLLVDDDITASSPPLSGATTNAAAQFNKLGFVAGVILRSKLASFERVLWRACRGNVFLRHAEIDVPLEDPITGDIVKKSVFIIFFQGDQLRSRVQKICEGFMVSLYPVPEMPPEVLRNLENTVTSKLHDLQLVLNQTEDHRHLVLSQVALNIRLWFIKVRKIKAIYHTLNLFNVNMAEKCLIAECWCPTNDLANIQQALTYGTEVSGSSVPSILHQVKTTVQPPTFNRNNTFTSSFQNIIDAYGVGTYQEVNPAPFTIITFPFLFAIMFGDCGHGIIMFLFALVLILREKIYLAQKSDNEIWDMIFGGRYMILLMGLFSIYTGLMYNECFSRSINLFGSAWDVKAMNFSESQLANSTALDLDPVKDGVFRGYPDTYFNGSGLPYYYGFDPIWQSAENKITFQNSSKMKSSIIFGMVQMFFGLVLALYNHLYFKDRLTILTEWIPQMIFLWAIVGYLCIIIIYKWIFWQEPSTAPSLLIGLINMFMLTPPSHDDFTWLYDGQTQVQLFVVAMAVICLPWMLLAKPAVIYYRRKKKAQYSPLTNNSACVENGIENPLYKSTAPTLVQVHATGDNHNSTMQAEYGGMDRDDVPILDQDQLAVSSPDTESANSEIVVTADHHQDEEEEKDFGEVMILQIIHTIEFSLSCVSHTASYLRLWALSLAHSELSEVLWTMVMHIGLSMNLPVGPIATVLVFGFFAILTVGILLVMEGLSAFLHALRLHWVEFQSKFYRGEGYAFLPFSFDSIIEGKTDD